jgi:hypothetical protein
MKKGDVRGLSTIVATLLVILLVIISVAIVWTVVRTVINNNAEQISLGKFTISLEIVSIKQNPTDVNIKVKRNGGEGELEGIVFAIFDGENTHTFEKDNISLNPLETKTFVIDYEGKIVSISIYPVFLTSSGKTTSGNLADTYYSSSSANDFISENCTPNCNGKECGDNGCSGSCGLCGGSTPYCTEGQCSSQEGEDPNGDCSCALTTCIGATCDDGIGGSCPGQLEPDCNNDQIMCGNSLNSCGSCGECDNGYYCNGGICSQICSALDCGSRECGGLPGREDCGETFCGLCTGQGESCNETSGMCLQCEPQCGLRNCGIDPVCGSSCGVCNSTLGENCNVSSGICEVCQPQCGLRNCGIDPVCGSSCGVCNSFLGEYCGPNGICIRDEALNSGTIFSVWPINVGIYFDSPDLPISGVNYNSYWVKFPGSNEFDCLQIDKFVTPVMPEIYNMSYVKFVQTSSDIRPGDTYQIWQKYSSCTSG